MTITRRWIVAGALVLAACYGSAGAEEGARGAASSPATDGQQTITHITPRPDSIGPTPARFAWTPAKDADRYAIGLWNEVDVLVWRRDDVREPAAEWPAGFRLDPGTYFWSVTALRQDHPIAESGRAAFIVSE